MIGNTINSIFAILFVIALFSMIIYSITSITKQKYKQPGIIYYKVTCRYKNNKSSAILKFTWMVTESTVSSCTKTELLMMAENEALEIIKKKHPKIKSTYVYDLRLIEL